jgi:hypothetical protein
VPDSGANVPLHQAEPTAPGKGGCFRDCAYCIFSGKFHATKLYSRLGLAMRRIRE